MLIRQETKDDHAAVHSLVKTAFKYAEYSDGSEHCLVDALRKSSAFIPELSLVAELDGKLAGHIMFTKGLAGSRTVLILAPLSVLPEFQNRGIGTALIKEGHMKAEAMGYDYSIVVGSETFYPRLGYIKADTLGLKTPDGIDPKNFMAIKLNKNAENISGAVTYPKEFGM